MAIQVGFEVDVSGFRKGMDQVKAASASIATGVGGVMKGAAAAFAGASAAVVVAAKGMYDAMSKGGELVDLSEQTGLAVDKLMELQVAFEQTGLGADEVGSVVNKMQRSIADAANGSAMGQAMFDGLGLSLQQLGQMDAAGQLEEVGNKIMAIEDPTKRSAAAMEIFGKSGGRMLALFASGGLEDAQKALGGQARLMAENAAYFDSITDKLGTAGLKVQEFFVGLASELVPDLMAAADAINGIDFSDIGVQIGKSMAVLIELFRSNTFGESFYISMQIAVMKTVNLFVQGFLKAVASIASPFLALGVFIGSAISNPLKIAFYKAGEVLMKAIGKGMEFLGVGMQKIPGLKDAGKSVFGAGLETQWKAIDFGAMGDALMEQAPSFQETLVQAGIDAANALKDTFDKIEGIDIFSEETSNKLEDLRALWQKAQATVQANKEKLEKPETKEKGDGLKVIPPKVNSQSFEAITSSLGKIGGGGISRGTLLTISPMVDQQKETNKLLRQNNQLMMQKKTVASDSGAKYSA